MRHILLISALLAFGSCWSQVSRVAKCDAFGAICFTKIKSEANFSIFIEETEGLAGLKVFKIDNLLYATGPGLWYVTEARVQAKYLVYIETERKSAADFTVAFTTNEAYAGCE